MPFVSELMGRKVTDIDGNTIGNLVDLIANQIEYPHPQDCRAKSQKKLGDDTVAHR